MIKSPGRIDFSPRSAPRASRQRMVCGFLLACFLVVAGTHLSAAKTLGAAERTKTRIDLLNIPVEGQELTLLGSTAGGWTPLPKPQSLRDLAGPKARRRPTVLFFWATWCESCARWSNQLRSLSRRSDVHLMTISTDKAEDLDKVFSSLSSKFSALAGQAIWINESSRSALGIDRIPLIAVVDDKGELDTLYRGAQKDKRDYFMRTIDRLSSLGVSDGH